MSRSPVVTLITCLLAAAATARGQQEALPTARIVSASRLTVPGAVDSNIPMIWDLVDEGWRLFAFASWGGIPVLMAGPEVTRLAHVAGVTIDPHPGDGVWIESVLADDRGLWYAYYHHEAPAHACERTDRQIPRIGAARSADRGLSWQDLGVVIEAAPDSHACGSSNRFVLGGVGDLSAIVDAASQNLFLYFSQYPRDPAAQGVAVARLAWADRDEPRGRMAIWRQGAWLPASFVEGSDEAPGRWDYPAGTPLVGVSQPWHDGNPAADAFWGPSIHWNTYLDRYVMLLNRAKDERFNNEGIYVSYARTLDDPAAWSAPRKIMNGGGWYPQVAGLEPNLGTDRIAGQRARFFLTGRSEHVIEFQR